MDDTTVVITGANGQLGRALCIVFPKAIALTRQELDITDEAAVKSFDWQLNSVIINAAAWTDVDAAENPENFQQVDLVNHRAVRYLAEAATTHGLTLVHISSEYVFDGSQTIHSEDELFSPLNVYGKTKADGDLAAATTNKHYIIRTSWVIGDGRNFVNIMQDLAARGVKPSVVNDQIGRLTFTDTLARGIKHLLEIGAPYGTYNLTNEGQPVSWADIAKIVFEKSGKSPSDVQPVSTAEYFANKPGSAQRPRQSALNLTKIKETGFTPEDWQDKLDSLFN
jgi:dTDP-4-dehydrorhamnose reductase / dTDP-4-dehydrorhamnose 3,5-epimerase